MKPIPLFGTGIRAISDIATRQRRVNVFYHIREDQDRAPIVLCGTPGAQLWITLPEGPIKGWHVIQSTMYVVAGTGLYSVDVWGTYTKLATLGAMAQYVSMADNSIQLMMVDGYSSHIYTLATGAVAPITDANFPVGALTVCFLNERFIVNKPGTREFYISALLDGFDWSSVGLPMYGTKENSSDLLAAVSVLNGTLILYGTQSTEFWQDVGSTPVPFQRVNGATQQWGLAAVQSRAFVGNTMMFLGTNLNNGLQVIKLEGYTPVRASTSDIENMISKFSTYSDAVALSYMVEGHIMYQLTFPTEGRSILFDTNTNMWQEVQTGTAEIARHIAQQGVAFNTKNYICDISSGNIYLFNRDHYTDNGEPIKRQVYTRHIRNAGNTVFFSALYLDFETGVGIVDGQGSDPQVMLTISKDGGRNFGSERWVRLGKMGESLTRVVLRRLGSAEDFVIGIKMTDPVKFVLAHGSAVIESSDE